MFFFFRLVGAEELEAEESGTPLPPFPQQVSNLLENCKAKGKEV